MMIRPRPATCVCFGAVLLAFLVPLRAVAADHWIEVKSPHFTVTSNSSPGDARTVAWEFEQIRNAISTLWVWAHVDVNKPLVIFAIKDENSMKALAPEYWERKNAIQPASVSVGGVDQNYIAIRTDVKSEDNRDLNPYQQAYFQYVTIIMDQSLPRTLPLWFQLGFAEVVSNTVVRDQKLFLGAPIPWYLGDLRSGPRLLISRLIAVDRKSPEYTASDQRDTLDAESWAFVHYLMFADDGARWSKLDGFVKLVSQGTDGTAAFREEFGSPDDLMAGFSVYIRRNLFSFRQFNVDVSVNRDAFPVRPLDPADEESRRALFHTAMGRPTEAHAAIDAARKAGAAPDSWVAEALLLEQAGKEDDAKTAYAHAADAGATDEYAYYRLASMMWQNSVDNATLAKIAALLEKAIALNDRDANAYAMLGEARSVLRTGDADGMALRAVSLEPSNAFAHYAAARVLRDERRYDDALQQAQAAATLATDQRMRQQATDLATDIQRMKAGGR